MIRTIICTNVPEHYTIFYPIENQHSKLFDFYRGLEKIDMIDLGCGVPVFAYLLHHSIGLNSFWGIDRDRIENRIAYARNNFDFSSCTGTEKKAINTQYDIYLKSFDFTNERIPALSKDEFDEFFTRKVMHADVLYLINRERRFNLLNASYLFHFPSIDKGDNIDLILGSIKNNCATGGIIMLRVKKSQTDFNYDKYLSLLNKHFSKGNIYESELESLFINQYDLLDI